MSNTNNHGGKRAGAGSGGPREGAGRKPQKATLELGSIHYTHVRTKEGKQSGPTMMLEVTKIERDCIELTNQHTGEIFHLVR